MNEAEKRRRASEADRLMSEPLLMEAFDTIEDMAIEEMLSDLSGEPDPDKERRILAERVNVIRSVRKYLASIIAEGKHAATTWRPA